MIIDSSAIVAVLNQEPGYAEVERALSRSRTVKVGSPTLLETGIVLSSRLGARGKLLLGGLLRERRIEVVEFGERHAEVALEAYRRFGKGHHPAKLNMGDCCSYATAAVAREPLLCIGDDFPQTDLELVDLSPPPGGAEE